MQNDVVEPPLSDHKLCGYLLTVLTIPNPSPPILIHSLCHVSADPQNPNFTIQDGVVLSPIVSPRTTPCTKKRYSRLGMVHGSISVVHQIHALVAQKCVKVVARVLGVSEHESGKIRVLMLVDVYLPTALWSGWQFPKLGHVAAALFKHLSCDWEARSLMLKSKRMVHNDHDIWSLTDCHVLGCKWHCMVPDSDKKKKFFEIQEIFKSLPSAIKKVDYDGSRVQPADSSCDSGIWVLSDDIMINILASLSPIDLFRISSTCRHFRYLAASVMPCMKLKLYPHQQAAIEWMLQREKGCEVLPHPLYMNFVTEDGFELSIDMVSGAIVTFSFPTITDFRGGMFCDEPGLGKTITALSLILKTQGTLAEPPDKTHMIWCMRDSNKKSGYYEVPAHDKIKGGGLKNNNVLGYKTRRGQLYLDEFTPKGTHSVSMSNTLRCSYSSEQTSEPTVLFSDKQVTSHTSACSTPATPYERRNRSWSNVKRNLLDEYDEPSLACERRSKQRKYNSQHNRRMMDDQVASTRGTPLSRNRDQEAVNDDIEHNETWVQCDTCGKWRKLFNNAANISTAWFCSMNSDPLYQSCNHPEESWDKKEPITCLRGFHTKGTLGGQVENTSFFVGVLKDQYTLMTSETKKALTWLVKLSPEKLAEMETIGLVSPFVGTALFDTRVARDFHKVFQAFGLIKRIVKGTMKWYYPQNLSNLSFDLDALRIALCAPLDSVRFYLSSATLIVVPSNLVDHWITQINQHIRPGQLRVYVWGDQKVKPSANDLAWDYDVVITTFSRLSAEWDPRKRGVLMQVHWLRVMLDEGHTLGSSLSMTNKLQMVVSLTATNRWLLTGTPTPTTPNSQLSYLQTVLKFLREEAYGLHQKSWETGILRPFEAEMEEGRFRLLKLLNRCMISARKEDLKAIPPCIKKVKFVDFSEVHAKSYNEFVETVRRNILMADWNDPSHVESLLNPKQWKLRAATIKNIRLSCCVAGHVRMTDAGQDIQETMDVFVETGLDPMSEEYALIKYKLMHGGSCMRCKEWCRLPVITPCRHFLCLDCVALDSEKCTLPGCGNLYEMQSPEKLARPENPNPKWPVPKDLIELQPSYKQDDWNPDWQSTSSSKVTYLINRLKEIQEANQIRCCNGDIDATSVDWEAYNNKIRNACKVMPVDKVIIFSQFLEHIHVIEQQLAIAGIQHAGMYSPMHSSNKMKSLATFQHDANCMVLLMDGSAALGLDLSFVTYVYLMEPIWDRSVEEQVISRAHRLGATRPIHVETLAMRGTIEEQMLKFLQDGEECRRLLKEELDTNHPEPQTIRTLHDFAQNNYLVHLTFVRTNSGKPKGIVAGNGFQNFIQRC